MNCLMIRLPVALCASLATIRCHCLPFHHSILASLPVFLFLWLRSLSPCIAFPLFPASVLTSLSPFLPVFLLVCAPPTFSAFLSHCVFSCLLLVIPLHLPSSTPVFPSFLLCFPPHILHSPWRVYQLCTIFFDCFVIYPFHLDQPVSWSLSVYVWLIVRATVRLFTLLCECGLDPETVPYAFLTTA